MAIAPMPFSSPSSNWVTCPTPFPQDGGAPNAGSPPTPRRSAVDVPSRRTMGQEAVAGHPAGSFDRGCPRIRAAWRWGGGGGRRGLVHRPPARPPAACSSTGRRLVHRPPARRWQIPTGVVLFSIPARPPVTYQCGWCNPGFRRSAGRFRCRQVRIRAWRAAERSTTGRARSRIPGYHHRGWWLHPIRRRRGDTTTRVGG